MKVLCLCCKKKANAINTNYWIYSYSKGACAYASGASENGISLPIHFALSQDHFEYTAEDVVHFDIR